MKALVPALLLLAWAAPSASGLQLERVTVEPAPTPHHKLLDVRFRDERTGWIVGSLGLALRTDDGGRSWRQVETGVREPLFSISLPDDRTGWIAGANGTLLRTGDGGRRWERGRLETREQLFVVRFPTLERGFVGGSFGTFLRTSDGGATWTSVGLDWSALFREIFEEKGAMEPHVYDVFFVDAARGWATGEFGMVLRTEDGGESWSRQRSGTERALYRAFFADSRKGWVVGQNGTLLGTEDAGETWTDAALEADESLFNVTVAGATALAVGERGAAFGSRDAGRTWARLPRNPVRFSSWMQGLSAAGANDFLVTGDRGAVFRLVWR